MNKKSYLASELSERIGVPRTTINDWLTKYAPYIDCDSRGKRRVYTEDAVTVLQEIAALRAAGKNAFEIAAALEAKHGVRPELEKADPEAAEQKKEPVGASSVPARQGKSDAMALFEEQMQQWQRQIAEAQEMRRKSTRRGFAALAVLIVLLFAAGGAAAVYFVLRAGERLQQEKRQWELRFNAMEQQREVHEKEQQLAVTQLAELLKLSERSRQEQLLLQKQQFEAELARLDRENRDRSAREQMQLREEFAAAQKKLLSELAEAHAEKAAVPPPPASPQQEKQP